MRIIQGKTCKHISYSVIHLLVKRRFARIASLEALSNTNLNPFSYILYDVNRIRSHISWVQVIILMFCMAVLSIEWHFLFTFIVNFISIQCNFHQPFTPKRNPFEQIEMTKSRDSINCVRVSLLLCW